MSQEQSDTRLRIFLGRLKTALRICGTSFVAFLKFCWNIINATQVVIQTWYAASLKHLLIAAQTAIRLIRTRTVGYSNKFVQFFGATGAISIIALLAAGLALSWVWRREELRPIVAVIAAGLGAFLAAASGFAEKGERIARWILAFSAGAFTVLFAWYTTSDLTDQLKQKTESAESRAAELDIFVSDLVREVKRLPTDDYQRVMAIIGFDILRGSFHKVTLSHPPPYRSNEFEISRNIISIIDKLEGEERNGHALVIMGEIERALKHPDLGNSRFDKYLAIEKGTTRNGKRGEEECRNREGLCRERTAWVFNQLAIGYYEQGHNLKAARRPEVQYKDLLSDGLKHACTAIKLFGPNGFVQPPTTRTVEKWLWDELGKGATKPTKDGICLESVS